MTILGEEKVSSCPLVFIRDNRATFNSLMRSYRFLELGMLPEVGGMNDQAAPWLMAMGYLSAGIREAELAQMQETRSASKAGAPGARKRR